MMANVIQRSSMKVSSRRSSLQSHVQGEGFRGRPPAALIKAKMFAFPLPFWIQDSLRQMNFPYVLELGSFMQKARATDSGPEIQAEGTLRIRRCLYFFEITETNFPTTVTRQRGK